MSWFGEMACEVKRLTLIILAQQLNKKIANLETVSRYRLPAVLRDDPPAVTGQTRVHSRG